MGQLYEIYNAGLGFCRLGHDRSGRPPLAGHGDSSDWCVQSTLGPGELPTRGPLAAVEELIIWACRLIVRHARQRRERVLQRISTTNLSSDGTGRTNIVGHWLTVRHTLWKMETVLRRISTTNLSSDGTGRTSNIVGHWLTVRHTLQRRQKVLQRISTINPPSDGTGRTNNIVGHRLAVRHALWKMENCHPQSAL